MYFVCLFVCLICCTFRFPSDFMSNTINVINIKKKFKIELTKYINVNYNLCNIIKSRVFNIKK